MFESVFLIVFVFTALSNATRQVCTDKYLEKVVEFEYKYPGFEDFWMTHEPALEKSKRSELTQKDKKFSWKLKDCGSRGNERVACLETASTGKQGHYFDAVNNKVKFEGDANALKKNKNYHFRLLCYDCKNPHDCELENVGKSCRLFGGRNRGFWYYITLTLEETWAIKCESEYQEHPSYYRWEVRFDGKPNGEEFKLIDEIENCSGGGQTLTKSVKFSEGVTLTNSRSISRSETSGFELGFPEELLVELKYSSSETKQDTFSSETSVQKSEEKTVEMAVLPGQMASIWQYIVNLGDFEMKTRANYSTVPCRNIATSELWNATDAIKSVSRFDNCGSHSSSIKHGKSALFQRGIINKEVGWHLNSNQLGSDPSLIAAIERSIAASENLSAKEKWLGTDWQELRIYQRDLEYRGSDEEEIPAGFIMEVKQLVLKCGNYTIYSAEVWHELETCPGYEFQSVSKALPLTQIEIGGIAGAVLGVVLFSLLLLLWIFRKKLCTKKYQQEVTGPSAKITIENPE